jgi:Excalibur calcium-binding domain
VRNSVNTIDQLRYWRQFARAANILGCTGDYLMRKMIIAVSAILIAAPAIGHGGGLAADGCHNDRKNGGRHCHRAASSVSAVRPQRAFGGGSAFANCSAARAAGAAPVMRSDPGYGSHLDRDNDGVGCE